MAFNLDSDIRYVKRVGPARAEVLKKMGITNIRTLLYFVPKGRDRYLFYRGFQNIADCEEGDDVVVRGIVTKAGQRWTRGRKKIFEVAISDDTGTLWGVWFNVHSYIAAAFSEGQAVIFRGKVTLYDKLQISHPKYEMVKDEGHQTVNDRIVEGTIIPLYPETAEFHEKIGQNAFRKVIKAAWDEVKDALVEPIPEDLRQEAGLCTLREMFSFLHFPQTKKEIDRGIHRYKFQELFSMELGIATYAHLIRKAKKKEPLSISSTVDTRIRKRFPFSFTSAQERAVEDIKKDITSHTPMNRLIQGDVGSGKTAVAVYAILAFAAKKRQVVFMAPTGILAEQHFKTFDTLLHDSQVRYRFLSGGIKPKERTSLLEDIRKGEVDVVIGTHALLQKDVQFRNLGLVIVDEQHKFGVLQRKELSEKGYNPDVLLMTATPIPRTLSMTAYGEYDISIIDEMPPGRTPVKTYWFSEKNRDKGYDIIRERVAKGEQVFIVCPLVEESEELGLKSAIDTHEDLSNTVFSDMNVGLIHGRMKDKDKDAVMERFRRKEIDILVATIVVEVGVDIPNATVMVIEHAERFGLAQLHQLRGRIGRGMIRSVCILFARSLTETARERIKIMTKTNDGFKIAEKDFEMRGPGEYFGTRQHGMPSLYLADLIHDRLLVFHAREKAFAIIKQDPDLKNKEHRYLDDLMKRKFKYGVELLGVT